MQSSISPEGNAGSLPPIDAAARAFRNFARHCHGESPLYERLARAIADDATLLTLAAQVRPGQPVANMLFAAVQYLLVEEPDHDLAAFYPAIGGRAAPEQDPLPAFRDFCVRHAAAISVLIRQRRTQTNEVGRCAYLLPAFTYASRLFEGLPLALIEIGASAGLNLRWDSYSYDYGNGTVYGPAGATPRITSRIRGTIQPPLPTTMPAVAWRRGIDLHPIDLHDADAQRWLRALVWPEQLERAALLQKAIIAAHSDPPPLLAGDALELLPAVIAAAPAETLLCLYHTHVIYQFTPAERQQLREQIAGAGAGRDLYYIAVEGVGTADPRLTMQLFRAGQLEEGLLAVCHHHGRWLQWIDATRAAAANTEGWPAGEAHRDLA